MINVYDNETGEKIGAITEEELGFLQANLEEEWLEDRDYYINVATLEMFEERGVDAGLMNVLRQGLRGRSEMEIRWSRN
jgi:hypothetical protein